MTSHEIERRFTQQRDDGDAALELIKAIDTRLRKHGGRLNSIDNTLAEHTTTLAQHTATLAEHTTTLAQHTATLAEHTIQLNSIQSTLNELLGLVQRLADGPTTQA